MLNSKSIFVQHSLMDCNRNTVPFHAILSTRLTNVHTNAIIKFGKGLVSKGSRYNPITGKLSPARWHLLVFLELQY